jgi:hypothetical protein
MKSPSSTPAAERLKKVAALYERLGSVNAVGDALGMTKQRAAQLLQRAAKAGIVVYPQRIEIAAADAKRALRETGGVIAAAAALGVSEGTFRDRHAELILDHKERVRVRRAREMPADVIRARAAQSAQAAKRREQARKDGICPMCLSAAARPGMVTCAECSAAASARRSRIVKGS